MSSATPQFVQNLLPGALSVAHLAHCMASSLLIRYRNANVAGMLLVGKRALVDWYGFH
jgi:hypothetical protein